MIQNIAIISSRSQCDRGSCISFGLITNNVSTRNIFNDYLVWSIGINQRYGNIYACRS